VIDSFSSSPFCCVPLVSSAPPRRSCLVSIAARCHRILLDPYPSRRRRRRSAAWAALPPLPLLHLCISA
jgi:hypothetical protein